MYANALKDLGLVELIAAIARIRGFAIQTQRVRAAIASFKDHVNSKGLLENALLALQLTDVKIVYKAAAGIEPMQLPVLLLNETTQQWNSIESYLGEGRWQLSNPVTPGASGNVISTHQLHDKMIIAELDFAKIAGATTTTFTQAFNEAMKPHRGLMIEAVMVSLCIAFVAVGISMFSMQVYDRVIPTRGESTLLTLAVGVLLAIVIEYAMKSARAWMMESVTVNLDQRMNREVFERLLKVRLDAMPQSVGSLAGQLRGFDQVRNFYTSSTIFGFVELPIGLLMLCAVAALGGPWLAAVPLVFAGLATLLGWVMRGRVNRASAQASAATYLKTGLLVEAVEGGQTIKTGGGSWRFLARWIRTSEESTRNELTVRSIGEQLGFISGLLQQLAYAGVVCLGAWQVMQGNMTMGGLIACTIISGRVMAPILALPNLLVLQAHAHSARKGLEALYALPTDHNGLTNPLSPDQVTGHFQLDRVEFSYPESPVALRIKNLEIRAGERVGIIGPIGSGKSTLLKLLAGLYQSNEGSIRLDGLDLQQIDRDCLNEHLGYLQQEHRLFAGSLRENLLIGLQDPGDSVLQTALTRSGLIAYVSSHPKGLELPIREGGQGLSGGQRQLVAFTRLLLQRPNILLLDEPTANMDPEQEMRCLRELLTELNPVSQDPVNAMPSRHATAPPKTLVVVTHKHSVLPLVDRLIVISGNEIVLDGPKQWVLETTAAKAQNKPVTQIQTQTTRQGASV